MDPIEICKTSRAVRKFMIACDEEQNKAPGFNKKSALWEKLIEEEYKELRTALDDAKFRLSHGESTDTAYAEILDACCDLVWVTIGLSFNMGLPFDEAFEEVRKTNMAKIDAKTGKVLRREDGKIMKPEGWAPPNLLKLIQERNK